MKIYDNTFPSGLFLMCHSYLLREIHIIKNKKGKKEDVTTSVSVEFFAVLSHSLCCLEKALSSTEEVIMPHPKKSSKCASQDCTYLSMVEGGNGSSLSVYGPSHYLLHFPRISWYSELCPQSL